MRWYGKLLGFIAGALLFRPNPLFGAVVGLLIGHAFDSDWFRLNKENPYRELGLTSEATDAEVAEAARLAHAHEFITRLPKEYETLVGERGVKLSGGERQRIAIARAILKNAPILVLDEATASLDSESEALIQKALHTLMEGKTVIAIAHRLSTLREMDRIIVLSGGEIAEDGTHEQLLTRGGIYAGLWSHQAGGFLADEFPAVESETVYG